MEKMIQPALLAFVGLFAIFCSVMDYDWFIGHRKAQFFVKLFGRTGTRIIYILIGVLALAMAVFAYRNGGQL